MLTPEDLKNYPSKISNIYIDLENYVIDDLARLLKKYKQPNAEINNIIDVSNDIGLSIKKIEKKLAEKTNISTKKVERLLFGANEKSYKQQKELYDLAGLKIRDFDDVIFLRLIEKSIKEIQGKIKNFTGSLGMGGTHLQQFYNDTLDFAYVQIGSSLTDYNTAINQAVSKLSKNGLQIITYESGHMNNVEVAVRRAVLTGLSQTTNKISEINVKESGVELVETSAHGGARPSHADWQGRIYGYYGRVGIYPDFKSSTGYDTLLGLGGVNCRHSYFPFFGGISKPAYTKKQLNDFANEEVKYNGQIYKMYDATQKQRQLETKIRQLKRQSIYYDGLGDSGKKLSTNAKLKDYYGIYNDFSRQTGLLKQEERFAI